MAPSVVPCLQPHLPPPPAVTVIFTFTTFTISKLHCVVVSPRSESTKGSSLPPWRQLKVWISGAALLFQSASSPSLPQCPALMLAPQLPRAFLQPLSLWKADLSHL